MFSKWLCAEEFASLEPINVFHREEEKIKDDTPHPEELKNYHMMVKKDFEYAGKPDSRIYVNITADDYYKLYINGRYVCQGPTSAYYFSYRWNRADVTDFLSDGRNTIEIHVYYQGLINRVWNSGDLRMGFAFEMHRVCRDEDSLILEADESWKYARSRAYISEGKMLAYSTQFAENIDTRLIAIPDDEYRSCVVKKNADYTFAAEPSRLMDVYNISPVRTERRGDTLFCDFGHEITGAVRAVFSGHDGDEVIIRCGEELNDDGTVRYMMRCGCDYEEYAVLSDGISTVFPYDYKAFRYCEIVIPCQVGIVSVTANVRHAHFDDDYCNIVTDDKVLESVFNLCKNGVKFGSQEVFVDCPSREKGQYAGDMTITGISNILLTGDTYMARKALVDQLSSSFIDKGIMAVAPGSLMQEIADYSLQLPILVLRDWQYTREEAFLRSCVPYLDDMLTEFAQYDRGDGLLDKVDCKWNLVDWPDNLRDGYDFPMTKPIGSGCHNVINAFYCGAVKQIEEIKDILHIPYENKSDALIAAFNHAFFDSERGIYTDCETTSHSALHSNILPLFYGLVPDGYGNKVCDYVMSKGIVCGVYMSYFLLKGLCRYGRYSDAYSLITSTGENSWYNMVREGGTTCFEAWGKDKKWNTSLCHPWASAPISVIIEDLAKAEETKDKFRIVYSR